MSKYVFKLTPLGSYFFGGTEKFSYGKKDLKSKSEYYIFSEKFPQQTAILGTLRYLMLDIHGVLKENFNYSIKERERCDELIGNKSFQLNNDCDYGVIKGISTVYLYDGENVLASIPMDYNQNSDVYAPMSINKNSLQTNINSNTWTLDGYNPKIGVSNDYVNASGKVTKSKNVFISETREGNRKTGDEKAFFKREYCVLKKGYSFVFEAEIDLDDNLQIMKNIKDVHIVSMGQKKTSFRLEIIDLELPAFNYECDDNKLIALSDIFIKDITKLKTANLAVYQTKKFSYMKKNKQLDEVKGNFDKVYTRRKEQNVIIKRGAVFAFDSTEKMEDFKKVCLENTALTKIGYNNLI